MFKVKSTGSFMSNICYKIKGLTASKEKQLGSLFFLNLFLIKTEFSNLRTEYRINGIISINLNENLLILESLSFILNATKQCAANWDTKYLNLD
ncbi:hypothetical protein BpHYR1_004018 [Brachionus plicatilis]|uniref:Uncharacterized protein n=1 Tax=Brachionus plicatilis TaxID=10195 RepID=A0A3M7T110_BRAPC|nr:hypothetical protein BpHYR1_004018 [Brachionus plicatilis]